MRIAEMTNNQALLRANGYSLLDYGSGISSEVLVNRHLAKMSPATKLVVGGGR